MTNRHQRRAVEKIEQADNKPWPSLHGGTENCGNCEYAAAPPDA